jgi:hypothetical protein
MDLSWQTPGEGLGQVFFEERCVSFLVERAVRKGNNSACRVLFGSREPLTIEFQEEHIDYEPRVHRITGTYAFKRVSHKAR